MNPWTFYDFLDRRGNNLIRAWIDSLPEKAAAKIDVRIIYMQATKTWPEVYVSSLKGWPDLRELRIVCAGEQFRPIFFYGPAQGEVTIVLGAKEKGHLPPGALERADENRKIVLADRKRIRKHVFRKKSVSPKPEDEQGVP